MAVQPGFASDLVGNPEDRFSHNEAPIKFVYIDVAIVASCKMWRTEHFAYYRFPRITDITDNISRCCWQFLTCKYLDIELGCHLCSPCRPCRYAYSYLRIQLRSELCMGTLPSQRRNAADVIRIKLLGICIYTRVGMVHMIFFRIVEGYAFAPGEISS